MKILLLGVNGQVGYELKQTLKSLAGIDLIALSRNECDLALEQDIVNTFKNKSFELVINAAAYTAVDQAEDEPELAYHVNAKAVETIARLCKAHHTPFIHLSTDYVFNGKHDEPYSESEPTSPIGVYGITKLAGEETIRQHLSQYIILRVSWVFGIHGHNFVKTILKLAQSKETLNIVDDQTGCPTSARDIARVIYSICISIKKGDFNQWGTYHYAGLEPTTWYDFANDIIAFAKEQGTSLTLKELNPIPTSAFPTKAQRPQNSILDTTKIETDLNIKRHSWKPYLQEMIQQLTQRNLTQNEPCT